MSLSLAGVPCAAKHATRNQDVCLLSLGPYEVPTTYLMTSLPFLVVVISGSAPRRPTRVRRASWDGRLVENARARVAEELRRGARVTMRSGESANDIVRVERRRTVAEGVQMLDFAGVGMESGEYFVSSALKIEPNYSV
jgi:hypothetical protein